MEKIKSSWMVIVASILTVGQYALTFFDFQFSGIILLQWFGWAIWLLSVYFGFAPIFIFRKSGGVAKGKSYIQTTKLVDTNLYAVVRHPQYLAGILFNFSMIFLAQEWLVILLGVISASLIYLDIQEADKEGIKKFGEEYHNYIERVPQINFAKGLIKKICRGKKMKIAIASGKGGTGKTTIATSLALSLIDWGNIYYLDCDVEAPNGHLFLNPMFNQQIDAITYIPQIQTALCTICGKCVEVCQFHALARVGPNILVFPQLCHGCGSCTWNCPEGAIVEVPNPIGVLDDGITKEGIQFSRGLLTISEPMATPIIRQLKKVKSFPPEAIIIMDAPPGASCSVVETLRGSDFALLVTEPTPFGLHDLKQMLGIVQEMNIPAGIVINRDGIGDNRMEEFLNQNHLPVMLRIPYLRKLAKGIASGLSLVDILPEYRKHLQHLYTQIVDRVNGGESC